jgi:mono/diheme cytochrome c family protein
LPHAIVHSAGVQDRDGGIWLLATLFGQFPFLAKLFASYPLKDAQDAPRDSKTPKSGRDYLTTDPAVLRRGKIAFADNCAQCHSSKRPANLSGNAEQQKEAWRQLVLRDDFLADNYLSDDERYPWTASARRS